MFFKTIAGSPKIQDKLGAPVVPLQNDFGGIFEFLKFGRISVFETVKSFEAEPEISN